MYQQLNVERFLTLYVYIYALQFMHFTHIFYYMVLIFFKKVKYSCLFVIQSESCFKTVVASLDFYCGDKEDAVIKPMADCSGTFPAVSLHIDELLCTNYCRHCSDRKSYKTLPLEPCASTRTWKYFCVVCDQTNSAMKLDLRVQSITCFCYIKKRLSVVFLQAFNHFYDTNIPKAFNGTKFSQKSCSIFTGSG